ncbi:MAG: hypothetical protein ACYCST_00715 [Acidimicrobiales bacterium]
MTAVVIGALAVLVVAALIWARVHSARSDRRSMESYGHGLSALGDITRRGGSPTGPRAIPRENAGRPHVDTAAPGRSRGVGHRAGPTRPESGQAPIGRPEIAKPPAPISAATRPLLFDAAEPAEARPERLDPSDSGSGAPSADLDRSGPSKGRRASADLDRSGPSKGRRASADLDRSGPSKGRRASVAALAAAALAVVAISAAAVELTGGSPSAKSSGRAHNTVSPSSTVTSTTVVAKPKATVVRPVSIAGVDATFDVPPGHYKLSFTAVSGACWVGIGKQLGASTLLWAETVQKGSRASYVASGPLAVELGAPEYASVRINGVRVKIPAGVTAYNLLFTAG